MYDYSVRDNKHWGHIRIAEEDKGEHFTIEKSLKVAWSEAREF